MNLPEAGNPNLEGFLPLYSDVPLGREMRARQQHAQNIRLTDSAKGP